MCLGSCPNQECIASRLRHDLQELPAGGGSVQCSDLHKQHPCTTALLTCRVQIHWHDICAEMSAMRIIVGLLAALMCAVNISISDIVEV